MEKSVFEKQVYDKLIELGSLHLGSVHEEQIYSQIKHEPEFKVLIELSKHFYNKAVEDCGENKLNIVYLVKEDVEIISIHRTKTSALNKLEKLRDENQPEWIFNIEEINIKD